jgi:calcineurin-like phosphoesterase family protein
MLYLTADLHLGHTNILTLGEGRPFPSIGAHDAALIDGINATVGEDDELWVLGDLSMNGSEEEVRAYRARICCRHVSLVLGNHDKAAACEGSHAFERVVRYARVGKLSRDGYRAVLFHYPILDWDGMYRGSYCLHGHIHSRPAYPDGIFDEVAGQTHEHAIHGYNQWCRAHGIRRYDVGVDANGYRPVSVARVLAFFGDEPAPTARAAPCHHVERTDPTQRAVVHAAENLAERYGDVFERLSR